MKVLQAKRMVLAKALKRRCKALFKTTKTKSQDEEGPKKKVKGKAKAARKGKKVGRQGTTTTAITRHKTLSKRPLQRRKGSFMAIDDEGPDSDSETEQEAQEALAHLRTLQFPFPLPEQVTMVDKPANLLEIPSSRFMHLVVMVFRHRTKLHQKQFKNYRNELKIYNEEYKDELARQQVKRNLLGGSQPDVSLPKPPQYPRFMLVPPNNAVDSYIKLTVNHLAKQRRIFKSDSGSSLTVEENARAGRRSVSRAPSVAVAVF